MHISKNITQYRYKVEGMIIDHPNPSKAHIILILMGYQIHKLILKRWQKTKTLQSNNFLQLNLSPGAPTVIRRSDNTIVYALIIHNCCKLGF